MFQCCILQAHDCTLSTAEKLVLGLCLSYKPFYFSLFWSRQLMCLSCKPFYFSLFWSSRQLTYLSYKPFSFSLFWSSRQFTCLSYKPFYFSSEAADNSLTSFITIRWSVAWDLLMIADSLPSSHYYPQKMAFSLPHCGVVKQWLHTHSLLTEWNAFVNMQLHV